MSCCNSNCNHDPCGSSFNQKLTMAAQYAQYAQTQANKAEDLWHEFNALYLGAFAVAPTQDNQGNPLQVGALYWNTGSNTLYVWSGLAWVADTNFNELSPFIATGSITPVNLVNRFESIDKVKDFPSYPFLSTGSTTPRNLANRMADVVNVKDFGAVGDGATDDTAAIQAAINYAATFPFSGAKIVFNGNGIYYFTNLTFPANTSGNTNGGIILDGNGCTMVKTSATGIGILVQGAVGNRSERRQNSAIINMKFTSSVAQTSGDLIKILNADHTLIENLDIQSAYNAITVVDAFDTRINNNYIRNSVSKDIYLYGTVGNHSTVETIITNIVAEGTNGNTTKTGLTIDSGVSGVFVTNCDFVHGYDGIAIKHSILANPLSRPVWLLFSLVLADTNANYGWAITGNALGIYLNQCWAASAGANGFGIDGASVISLNDCIAKNNGQHGVSITGSATEVHINGGLYACNSVSTPNTYNGINIGSNVSNFAVRNARSGNIASLLLPGIQQAGIYVSAGTSDNYQLIGNNCLNNQTAALASLGTGLNKKIADNLGFNPVGYSAISVPASGVPFTNNLGIDAVVYVTSGTVTGLEVNYKNVGWVSTGFTSGTVNVPANASIRVTYSVAPTWIWFFN